MAIGRISGQMLKANLLRSGSDLAFETNLLVLDVTNSFVGIGTASPARQLHINGTGALRIPAGTTAERGSSANGDIRYNTDDGTIEGYSGGAWTNLASAASLEDSDGDTKMEVERTSDEDILRFQTGGTDVAAFGATALELGQLSISVTSQTINGTVTNGDITVSPNGTGQVVMDAVNIGGGEIDGTPIGANSASTAVFTDLTANGTIDIDSTGTGNIDNVVIGANTAAAGTFTDLTANGTIDIDSTGNMDGIVIGANTAAAGTFTSLETSGNATIGGDLTVNGTTTTIDSQTLTIEDPLIQLAKNNSGGAANTFDQGLFFNRGSDDNVSFLWDESADQFVVAVTSGEDGSTAGNVTIDSYAAFRAGTITGSDVETGTISAADGTEAATIADSTGIITIPSSVLTTTDINGGTIDGVTIGGASAGAGTFTDLTANGTIDIDSTGNMDGIVIGANTAAAGTFTTVTTTGNIDIDSDSASLRLGSDQDFTITHNGTSNVITSTSGSVNVNAVAGSSVNINSGGANVDFNVNGENTDNLLYVDASNDRIIIAGTSGSFVLDASASTDAFALPSGTTAQRPTAATGIIRFNSENGKYEGSTDGSTYVNFQLESETPTISKVSATGDGSTTTFTGFFGSAPAAANNVLVFIDNVYQEPTENYTVSGTNITFTSAPHSAARIFAITGFDNTAAATGGIARTQTSSVSFESTATTIVSFNENTYRSAELFVTVTDSANTEYSAMKAVVVHDGTTAYITTYGITNTGGSDMVTLTAEHDGSNTVEVKAVSTGGAQTAKVQYSLQAV